MPTAGWQFISTLVGGLIVVASNFLLHWLQSRDEKRKQSREDELKVQELKQTTYLKQVQSDATCWRLVKHHLDELWWETESVAPGVRGTTAIGYVQPVNIRWVEHWNAISKISGSFSLHDSKAQETLDKLRTVAMGLSVNAGMAQFARTNQFNPDHTIKLSAEANRALDEFRDLYRAVNITIRDSIGFETIYTAPLISVQGLPSDTVTLPDENHYKF